MFDVLCFKKHCLVFVMYIYPAGFALFTIPLLKNSSLNEGFD